MHIIYFLCVSVSRVKACSWQVIVCSLQYRAQKQELQVAQLCSPELTGIGLVNGKRSFLTVPPQNQRPIAKKLSQVIMSTTSVAVQNFVEIRPWGGFWANR